MDFRLARSLEAFKGFRATGVLGVERFAIFGGRGERLVDFVEGGGGGG